MGHLIMTIAHSALTLLWIVGSITMFKNHDIRYGGVLAVFAIVELVTVTYFGGKLV